MKRTIKKIAVIGSGIMGSGIACHFANIGVEVLLLDIIPNQLTDEEEKKGLTLESKVVRNRLVNEHLANSLKSKPSPIYNQKFASRITTGNTTDDLAKIALMTAKMTRMFGMEPVIAMVSFSNFGSSSHESANKVREAVAYLHKYYPDLIVDGEIQSDFALNAEMLKAKFPFSKLAGKKVNTLIFPNLEAANITYKLLKELYKVDSIGPIMLGMEKAVHIFQLGASVEEMVNMVAVAVVDAQEKEKRKKMSAK
mgnify:CR=1 FL=1